MEPTDLDRCLIGMAAFAACFVLDRLSRRAARDVVQAADESLPFAEEIEEEDPEPALSL